MDALTTKKPDAKAANGGGKKKAVKKKTDAKQKDSRPAKVATPESDTGNERNAERRVALLRNKLTQAMEDPLTRNQIVQAIRAMMRRED